MKVTKHVVVTVDPTAEHEWQRLSVRDPITHHSPDLKDVLAHLYPDAGSYLIKVSIETETIEKLVPEVES